MRQHIRPLLPVFLVILVICNAACIEANRLNAGCSWTGDAALPLDLRREADQQHLSDDVQVAEELGVRYGDSFLKSYGIDEEGRRRTDCTTTLFAEIARIHGVSSGDVLKARGHRVIGYDTATVLLPMTVLFCLAASYVVGRVYRRFPNDEKMARLMATLVASVFVTSMGFQVGSIWSFIAESYRLRDGHVSYRAFYLPWSRHWVAVLCVGFALFWVVAFIRYRFQNDTNDVPALAERMDEPLRRSL